MSAIDAGNAVTERARPKAASKRAKDLSSSAFGRLKPISIVGRTPAGKAQWICKCECGNTKVVTSGNLTSGQIQSCGCLKREIAAKMAVDRSFKHGHAVRRAHSGEYRSYRAMLSRCNNPNATSYHLYGGRGISVCERWLRGDGENAGFDCFLADMGPRPSASHSIDRWPDGDGGYRPGNCRWATPKQQGGNGVRKRDELGEAIDLQSPRAGTAFHWLMRAAS
ncbi:hypothetical protein FHS82_001023 [Pseudochelatococcus lubricantis]|uniref:Uncharacterized protein n=1 Tax=Pseudochelatococcus lubricantis TaxID=1538102 RepID=A0ABX0UW57_9HYPH|nr:hypothetical protein [Pseudochelatococcus lubricantis]